MWHIDRGTTHTRRIHTMVLETWKQNVHRLFRRWDPRGLMVGDADAKRAIAALKAPHDKTAAELARAYRDYDAAVHPVLEQAIPSAFRLCSFLPVTSVLSLAMISSNSSLHILLYHWLYQSHSAATRYCNYADTSRPLDQNRMMTAYAASTGVAWGVSLGAIGLFARLPRLRLLGLIVPHTAVACAGAISTVVNAEVELRDGVSVVDAAGNELGKSREAAKATVSRAVLLHGMLVPSCALLLPVVTMRGLVVPRMMQTAPIRMWTVSAALVLGCSCVVTPLVAATVPPVVDLTPEQLEPELAEKLKQRVETDGQPLSLRSSLELY